MGDSNSRIGYWPPPALVAALLPVVLATGCGGGGGGTAPAQPSPSPQPQPMAITLATQRVFPALSFTEPVSLQQAPGDASRWYLVERRGIVRVFDNDPAAATAEVFVNISGRVNDSFNESGLLGLAFHPAFPSIAEVFLSYTTATPLVSRVSRFLLDGTGLALDPDTEEVLLQITQPQSNHNGGDLAFGPTGLLFAGFGDGGGGGDPGENGQSTQSLLGAVIRIDVDSGMPYAIPADNPFAGASLCSLGSGSAPCPEIYAWGFRNPWRMSFDTATGSLWLGDVGQGSWEEVNRVERGGNYGWNDREGAHCFEPPSGCATGFAEPVAEYGRGVGQSVTGGFVYRGSAIAGLAGQYVFGDFVSGALFAVDADSQPTVTAEPVGNAGFNLSAFAVDSDGELYVLNYGSGTIHRVVASP